jgi:chemotaxis protein methyltransferase CheR
MEKLLSRLRVVIIDEAIELCGDMRRWLEQGGHETSCWSLSEVSLASVSTFSPDLVVCGISSYDSPAMVPFRKLSNHRHLRHVPLIVVSNDPDLEYEILDIFDFQIYPCDYLRLKICLQRLKKSRKNSAQLVEPTAEQLGLFKEYLDEHSGLHFNQNNQRILVRGLVRRTQALRVESMQAYYEYLTASSENYDELNKLVGLLTIGETSFFRYRSHREALLHYVFPRLIEKNRQTCRLRIWSAGCSTGEEPYSMAILLLEHFPELVGWDIQILATDINKRALRHARGAVYSERSLRMMEQPLRDRYFAKSDSYYSASNIMRSMVRFDYLNLQTDPFPEELDLLFCRNVLIYFEIETIRSIVKQFSSSLKPGGYLFMGHSETMQNVSDRFQRHHQHNAFFYQLKKGTTHTQQAPQLPARKSEPPASKDTTKKKPKVITASVQARAMGSEEAAEKHTQDAAQLYQRAVSAFEHERFKEAEKLFDQLLQREPQNPRALIGKGLLLANQGAYSDARLLCARAVKEDDLLPEAYLLRGLILDMEGLEKRALVEYQKVLWLEPDFVMAHYLSAKVHGNLKDKEKRRRSLRNTIRSLEQYNEQGNVPFSGGLSRSVFLEIAHKELTESFF